MSASSRPAAPADLAAMLQALRLHLLALQASAPYYHARLRRIAEQLEWGGTQLARGAMARLSTADAASLVTPGPASRSRPAAGACATPATNRALARGC